MEKRITKYIKILIQLILKLNNTQRIRKNFLILNPMESDKIHLVYYHYNLYIAGGVVPQSGPLDLETIDPLKANYFLERRKSRAFNSPSKMK